MVYNFCSNLVPDSPLMAEMIHMPYFYKKKKKKIELEVQEGPVPPVKTSCGWRLATVPIK